MKTAVKIDVHYTCVYYNFHIYVNFYLFKWTLQFFFNILLIYVNRGPQVKVNITAPVSSLSWPFIYEISKYFQKEAG